MSFAIHRSIRTPLRVAAGYLVFGILWIVLSDRILNLANLGEKLTQQVQSVKGLAFVLLSAVVIYFLVRREVRQVTRTNALLQAVTEGTTDVVFVKDLTGKYLLVNPAGSAYVGLTVDQVLGRRDTDFFPPASAKLIAEYDRRVMETGRVFTEQETLDTAGVQRTFLATKAPYRDERGRVIGLVGISRDITAQAESQRELAASEERFRTLVEHASDGIFITDADGRFVEVNPAACRMTGRTHEELLRLSLADMVDAEEASRIGPELAKLRAEKTPRTEWRLRRPDGSVLHADVSARFLPDGRFLGIVRDITERKRSEQALEHTRVTLRKFVENTPAAIAMLDRDLRYLAFSRRWLQDYGLGDRDLRGLHHYDVFPEIRSMPRWMAIHQRCLAGQVERCEEDRFVRPDGRDEWLRWEVRPWRDEKGEIGGIIMYTESITQRVHAAQALRESERRFRTIVETTSEWIWSTDLEGRHTMSNPAVARVLGYEQSEIVGRPAADLMHPEDRAKVEQWLPQCIAGKRGWSNVVIRWRQKDGGYRWLESNASPILDDDGNLTGFFGADRDITERIRAEEALRDAEAQLRQSQKMEAVGQLAGGVAHDFNNLLTVINGYCEMLLHMAEGDARRHGVILGIADAGQRATAITRQLLAFSRRQVLDPRVIDLNKAITEIDPMLHRMVGPGVRVVTQCQPGLSPVRVDPGQIDQVIMNLALNARDAMPAGGTLTIETRDVEIDSTFASRHPDVRPGRYIMLTMRDTGTGIDPAVINRVFEPFFTTKEAGKGTGLGLAVVHGIVKQSGGHIDVQSPPHEGATFRIYLPAVPREPGEKSPTPSAQSRAGSETILLVEDNHAVREFAAIALESQGYHVLKAEGGAEAMRIADAQEVIDLLVTDIVMPEMDGHRVAQLLRARRPGLRALFVSGYNAEAALAGAFPFDEAFLQKPFTMTSLNEKVRALLDQPVST